MNKTQQRLADRIEQARLRGDKYIDVDGMRECLAAQALVGAGKASSYERHSGWTGGDYYIHPFTRRAGVTKRRFYAAGRVIL